MLEKRFVFCCAFFLFLSSTVTAEDAERTTWNIRTGVGILAGSSFEYVRGNTPVSELEWPYMPLLYAYASADLCTSGGFFASADIKVGIPEKTGTMTDSDFLNGDGSLTHFSAHNCFSDYSFDIRGRVGKRFTPIPRFTVTPFFEFTYLDFKWTAKDGYFQYPQESQPPYAPWTEDREKKYISGTGISYRQQFYIPAAGASCTYEFSGVWEAGFSLSVTPFAVCCAVDRHFFKSTEYRDTMFFGIYTNPEISVSAHINSTVAFEIRFGWRNIFNLRGSSTIKESDGPDRTYPGIAGAGLSTVDAALSCRITL